MPDNVDQLTINQIVSFISKNTGDSNLYHGKIIGILTWEEAIKFGDIVAYNNNMRNQVDGYDLNFKDLTYIVLQRYTYADISTNDKIIFAKEWIDESYFTIDSMYNDITIKVFGVPDDQINNILDSIKNMGYLCITE